MDLKNFEGTSTLAIEAVYRHFWDMIPSKYKLPEDDEMVKDLSPFYDPQLTFDNRLHYKLSKVEYPKRATPWFVITWNTENGLLNSSLSRRRFESNLVDNPKYGKISYKFINTDLQINFGICCNSMNALFELQENIILHKREKMVVYTKPHSIIGKFPVSLNIIDSHQNKLEREKSTLCYLLMTCKVDYPIIGMINRNPNIIEKIYDEINADRDPEKKLTNDTILPEDEEQENTLCHCCCDEDDDLSDESIMSQGFSF